MGVFETTLRFMVQRYMDLLPDDLASLYRGGGREASSWIDALTGTAVPDIRESFRFYRHGFEVWKKEPLLSIISYTDPQSLLYQDAIAFLIQFMPARAIEHFLESQSIEDTSHIPGVLSTSADARNAFRTIFETNLIPDLLHCLYAIVYLQSFSSGGESVFVHHILPHSNKGPFLDAGCGSGFTTLLLGRAHDGLSIDFSPLRLNRAEAIFTHAGVLFQDVIDHIAFERTVFDDKFPVDAIPWTMEDHHVVHFKVGNLLSLDLPAGFGTIICMDVLEHTANPWHVLEILAGSLSRGGELFITIPTAVNRISHDFDTVRLGATFPFFLHLHFFDPEELEKQFEQLGLTVFLKNAYDTINPADDPLLAEHFPVGVLPLQLLYGVRR